MGVRKKYQEILGSKVNKTSLLTGGGEGRVSREMNPGMNPSLAVSYWVSPSTYYLRQRA